jgi:hypothetical protein
MEKGQALDEMMLAEFHGVASFGYIGCADREFLLKVLEEHCQETLIGFTHNTAEHEEVFSICTAGDCQKVQDAVNFFADVIHELNCRAVFSKCFSGNPDLPIHVM